MFVRLKNSTPVFSAIVLLAVAVLLSGCGAKQTAQAPAKVDVKAMQVVTKDAPITGEFIGEVVAKEEVELKTRVSGQIIAKMVEDGQTVRQGQPLFQVDRREYEAVLLNRKANLSQAQADLIDTRIDVERYKYLAKHDAISQQTLDQTVNKEKQKAALVESNQALLIQAKNDIDDTLIVSPIDGAVRFNSMGKGNFVQAGQTVLATISSIDPIYVKFSLSETNYLQILARNKEPNPGSVEAQVRLTLSDGSVYPLAGQIIQVERAVSEKTGTISLKAVFDNPEKILAPGMFARVLIAGGVQEGALLVPQRAIQDILGKSFVTVVKTTPEGDKAESCAVKLGSKHGDFQIIEEGIAASDKVVVEGLTKVKPGVFLNATMIGPDDLNTPARK